MGAFEPEENWTIQIAYNQQHGSFDKDVPLPTEDEVEPTAITPVDEYLARAVLGMPPDKPIPAVASRGAHAGIAACLPFLTERPYPVIDGQPLVGGPEVLEHIGTTVARMCREYAEEDNIPLEEIQDTLDALEPFDFDALIEVNDWFLLYDAIGTRKVPVDYHVAKFYAFAREFQHYNALARARDEEEEET